MSSSGPGRVLLWGWDGLSSAVEQVLRAERQEQDQALEVVVAEAPGAPVPDDVDVVVGVCAAGLAETLVEVGRSARAAGVPFLPVWIEGLTGHVGPAMRPDGGPCLRCYLLRRASNDLRWE